MTPPTDHAPDPTNHRIFGTPNSHRVTCVPKSLYPATRHSPTTSFEHMSIDLRSSKYQHGPTVPGLSGCRLHFRSSALQKNVAECDKLAFLWIPALRTALENRLLDHSGIQMMALDHTGAWISTEFSGNEYILPSPVSRSIGILPRQCMRQVDGTVARGLVLFKQGSASAEMAL